MENDNNKFSKNDSVFSKVVRAGRRRTYFFDVKTTRSNDYFLSITESKKRFDGDGFSRHKVFVYKEDINKFVDALEEVVSHLKQELLPEYDFDEFSHDNDQFDDADNNDNDDVSSSGGNDSQSDDMPEEDDESIKWD